MRVFSEHPRRIVGSNGSVALLFLEGTKFHWHVPNEGHFVPELLNKILWCQVSQVVKAMCLLLVHLFRLGSCSSCQNWVGTSILWNCPITLTLSGALASPPPPPLLLLLLPPPDRVALPMAELFPEGLEKNLTGMPSSCSSSRPEIGTSVTGTNLEFAPWSPLDWL